MRPKLFVHKICSHSVNSCDTCFCKKADRIKIMATSIKPDSTAKFRICGPALRIARRISCPRSNQKHTSYVTLSNCLFQPDKCVIKTPLVSYLEFQSSSCVDNVISFLERKSHGLFYENMFAFSCCLNYHITFQKCGDRNNKPVHTSIF